MLNKICSRCKESKSLKSFYKDKYKSDGLTVYCKSCSKNIYDNSPEWVKNNRRKSVLKRYYKKHNPGGKPGSIRHEAILAGFRSGFERSFALDLQMRGIEYEYESIKLPYILEGIYNPDFYLKDYGIILEIKGVLTSEDRRKMRAVKTQHPELDIRLVFMDASKKIPHGKITHAQWAERNDFVFADGKVPDEWLK